jgi:hypothetical protein
MDLFAPSHLLIVVVIVVATLPLGLLTTLPVLIAIRRQHTKAFQICLLNGLAWDGSQLLSGRAARPTGPRCQKRYRASFSVESLSIDAERGAGSRELVVCFPPAVE